MNEPILAEPLGEKEKERIFADFNDNPKEMLDRYVEVFLIKNGLEGYKNADISRRTLLASSVLAVAAAIEITLCALYHNILFLFAVIIEIAFYIVFFRTDSLKKYLVKEIIRRPDDNIDNILISQVSGARNSMKNNVLITCPLLIVVLAGLLIFMRPHMIFEENSRGGYSLRYYTASLLPEKTVEIPNTYKGKPVNEIRGEVFRNIGSMEHIILPSKITEIRASTFESCINLKEIDIPEGVTRIASHAFYDCRSLSKVTVPSTVTYIGSSAFRKCESLKEIKIPSGAKVNARAFKESPTKVYRY